MRLFLFLIGSYMPINALAQDPQQKLRIQITYEKAGQYVEQAVETIEATSIVGEAANVGYQAGQSVIMLPGFRTESGSTFVAEIKAVEFKEGASLKLAAFPNPFEHSTTIEYYLPSDGVVNLWITDSQGKIVGQIVKAENQSAGTHSVEWRPNSLADGIYIPIIEANQQKAVSRLVKK